MEMFITCFDKDGVVVQCCGISEKRKLMGERISDVEGLSWGRDFVGAKDVPMMEKVWDQCIAEGGKKRIVVQSAGEWWAIKLVKIPKSTTAITVSTLLPDSPPRLTAKEVSVLKMMVDDTPTCEQREKLGVTASTYNTMTATIRKKVGAQTNFGVVVWALKYFAFIDQSS